MYKLFKDNRTGKIVRLERIVDANTYIVRGPKSKYMVDPKDLTHIKVTSKNTVKDVD